MENGNGNLKPWQPGQCGNPKGRPPLSLAIAELARNEIERRDLVAKLGAIAARKGSQQVKAIEVLLSYAYGKPQANLTVSTESAAEVAQMRALFTAALEGQPDEVRYAIAAKLYDMETGNGKPQ